MSVTRRTKRKVNAVKTPSKNVKVKRRNPLENVTISSSESEDDGQAHPASVHDDFFEETAQEKKMRLTKQYLEKLKEMKDSEESEEDDLIGQTLKDEVLEKRGRLQRNVADSCREPVDKDINIMKGHKLSPTCVAVSNDGLYAFTGSKDCCIIKWCTTTGKRLNKIKGNCKGNPDIMHTSHILCIALSTDNKFLVSGGKDKLIHVWNPEDCSHIHVFKGHRDAITGVALRLNSHQLFSTSLDKCVKVWSLDMLSYVETLYGHQNGIQSCDSLTRERCATAGGRDGTLRIWKIVEESQLVYHGHKGCIDCLKLINEEYMISGSDDGSICLWSVMKKKPIFTFKNAHKNEDGNQSWITSVGALVNTNLVASGSSDGFIKLWKCAEKHTGLELLFKISVKGFVNSLAFTKDGKYLFAAIGQEHRLGRWWSNKEAKNTLIKIQIAS